MKILSSVKDGCQGFYSTLAKINTLTIEQLERVGDRQLDCARGYGKIALKQLKAAQNIDNLADIKGFTSDTVERTGTMAKQVLEDSKELVDLGVEYRDQLVGVVKTMASEEGMTSSADTPSGSGKKAEPATKVKKTAADKDDGGVNTEKKS